MVGGNFSIFLALGNHNLQSCSTFPLRLSVSILDIPCPRPPLDLHAPVAHIAKESLQWRKNLNFPQNAVLHTPRRRLHVLLRQRPREQFTTDGDNLLRDNDFGEHPSALRMANR